MSTDRRGISPTTLPHTLGLVGLVIAMVGAALSALGGSRISLIVLIVVPLCMWLVWRERAKQVKADQREQDSSST